VSNHQRVPRRRTRFDDDGFSTETTTQRRPSIEPQSLDNLSTYRDAAHGPDPVPAWVVTDSNACDDDLGVFKTGKEADCSLIRRTGPSTGQSCLIVAKRYRDSEHRLFHRDAGYLEGRRVRRSRENRAMATRTSFGRELIAGQWARTEFGFLGRLWSAGASVPYPVQLIGTEIMMEFVGSPDGVAAPRLAGFCGSSSECAELYSQCREVLGIVAGAGYTHGDLSPFNILVHDGRIVLIDLPQVVDVVGNPQGRHFLERDCLNLCTWFAARGVPGADAEDLADELWRCAT
jgi:RIO kinase 1